MYRKNTDTRHPCGHVNSTGIVGAAEFLALTTGKNLF